MLFIFCMTTIAFMSVAARLIMITCTYLYLNIVFKISAQMISINLNYILFQIVEMYIFNTKVIIIVSSSKLSSQIINALELVNTS